MPNFPAHAKPNLVPGTIAQWAARPAGKSYLLWWNVISASHHLADTDTTWIIVVIVIQDTRHLDYPHTYQLQTL